MPKKDQIMPWSATKRQVAEALGEGEESHGAIAKRFGIRNDTISRWKRDPDFIRAMDDVTLRLERHTRAGMLRRIDAQQANTTVRKDEWTKLEEFKAKLQGFDKLAVDVKHRGTIAHTAINSSPDVLDAANTLAKKIAESKS